MFKLDHKLANWIALVRIWDIQKFCVNELSKIRWKEKESSTFSSTQRQHPVWKNIDSNYIIYMFSASIFIVEFVYNIWILISVFGQYKTQLYIPTAVVLYELPVKVSTRNLSTFIFDAITKIRILKKKLWLIYHNIKA